MRLFVALELPVAVRTVTGAWAAAQLSAVGSLRIVRVDGLHLTLCFLGSTATAEIDAIATCCRAACAGRRPLQLSIGELLGLPRRRPRAVAVRVDDEGHGRLAELQRGVAAGLAAGGWYQRETRPFLAHVTVARVRSGARLDPRVVDEHARTDATTLAEHLPSGFTANLVTLFQSRTQPGGAVYEPRARIELAA